MKSVFISHSNLEPDLTVTMQLYKFLSEKKIDCWVDALLKSGTWKGQIGEVMYDTPIVIFVASRNSMKSPSEVLKEVGYFLRQQGKTVIPFVLDSAYYLNPDREAAQAIYDFGANALQAVFVDKYADLNAAFERLLSLLPPDIIRSENNPSDFVYGDGDKILTAYKGNDPCVSVPPYVEKIGEGAFRNNETLTKIIIPPSVRKIGIRAFFGCANLVAAEGMEGLEEVEASAFDGSGLAPCADNGYSFEGIAFGKECQDGELTVDDGIRIIANEAFRYCGVKKVILPEGLKTIGELAFADSIFLEEIAIPATVVRMGKNAFRGCTNLKTITFEGEIPENADEAFEAYHKINKGETR